jgi:hypothetical protein
VNKQATDVNVDETNLNLPYLTWSNPENQAVLTPIKDWATYGGGTKSYGR